MEKTKGGMLKFILTQMYNRVFSLYMTKSGNMKFDIIMITYNYMVFQVPAYTYRHARTHTHSHTHN